MKFFLHLALFNFIAYPFLGFSEPIRFEKKLEKLFEQADTALDAQRYSEASTLARQIKKHCKKDKDCLRCSQQLSNDLKEAQRGRVIEDPFSTKAAELISKQDYATAKQLCEQMLKREPCHVKARTCFTKSEKALAQKNKRQ